MDYWDTAVERGSTGYGASPKKIGAMFPASTIFLFNTVLRQARIFWPELFGRHVYFVFDPNTALRCAGFE
jgi:hypothetical protein